MKLNKGDKIRNPVTGCAGQFQLGGYWEVVQVFDSGRVAIKQIYRPYRFHIVDISKGEKI